MLTLIIIVGIYAFECVGSSCYSISMTSFEAMLALGFLESIYEVKGIIHIFRKRDSENK